MRSSIFLVIFSFFFSAIEVLSQRFACVRIFNPQDPQWYGFCSNESSTKSGVLEQAVSSGFGGNDESKVYFKCNAPRNFVYCCSGMVNLPTVRGCIPSNKIN